MDGTGNLFYRQYPFLSSQFNIRTFSFNQQPARSWSDLVNSVQEHCLRNGPSILCGESFGGCLALAVASQCPQSVTGLIVINAASSFRRNVLLGNLFPMLRVVPDILFTLSSDIALGWLAETSRIAQGDLQRFLDTIRSVNKQELLERLQLLKEFDVSQLSLETIEQPALLLASGSDRILPSVQEAQRLARRLPNATVQLLPDSGHACLLERNLNLFEIAQTQNWLSQLSSVLVS